MYLQRLLSRARAFELSGFFLAKNSDALAGGPARTRVLVVDDEDHVRQITKRMLSYEGYLVIEARSGAEALTRLGEHPEVSVALIDLVMPGMNGLDLASKLREAAPHCAIVLMTGFPAEQARIARPPTNYPLLMKPFTSSQLVQQLRQVLEDSRH
jgi:CheY-like chemotaxis protein